MRCMRKSKKKKKSTNTMRGQRKCSKSCKHAPNTCHNTHRKRTHSAKRGREPCLAKQALSTAKWHIRRRRGPRGRSTRSSTSQVRTVRSNWARLICELALGGRAETFGANGVPEGRAAVGRETRAKGLPIDRDLRWVRVAWGGSLNGTAVL